MSFVTTQPEALAAAAGNLQAIGSALNAQNAAAAAPTTGVVPAAADEVSALTATQFAAHASLYQSVAAQAAAIHEMFVATLNGSAESYAATEAANAVAAGQAQPMLDYGALPPEINSGRMYTGPGSAPMMSAASAWRTMAAELAAAAHSYETVVTQLSSEEWLGPGSASMSAAATPYIAWMNTTAAQAEQAAVQATAAAGAFETARAATVPPAAVTTNRVQQAALVATNILGINTPAIAALDAHYAEMWAQDAAAMYGYAGSSATASQVTPFKEPDPTTNTAGLAGQSAAVAQATGNTAHSTAQTAQLISTMPNAIQGLASPAAANGTGASTSWIESAIQFLYNDPLNGVGYFLGTPMYSLFNTMGTGAA